MTDGSSVPMLVVLVGPPAVGKMTVGHELAARTGLRLFHNHHTIDLVLRFFAFGTPPFQRLVGEFRRRMFEEVAASELPGLVFTYVWAFDHDADAAAVESYVAPFRARGGRVIFVELEATQEERLRRNETPFRLAEKPFKRDLAASRARLLADDAAYQLNSHGASMHERTIFGLTPQACRRLRWRSALSRISGCPAYPLRRWLPDSALLLSAPLVATAPSRVQIATMTSRTGRDARRLRANTHVQ